MEGYTITTTTGAYLRETMRAATADTLDATMDAAAAYIGETAERETLDDGRVVQGSLVARPVSA